MTDQDNAIHALHRYFVWANRLRQQFEDSVRAQGPPPTQDGKALREWFLVPFFHLSYWLATLYVVVDGWRELGLASKPVDALLDPTRLELLRRYRNGVYHFQADYFDSRFANFLDSEDTVEWASALHDKLSSMGLRGFKWVLLRWSAA